MLYHTIATQTPADDTPDVGAAANLSRYCTGAGSFLAGAE